MADSFFGFDTSLSNLNDDDGGGGDGSEDEYDALNDETFGDETDADWEVEHEHLADQLESSRRHNSIDDNHSLLEASLSQLVLDETDAPSSAFQHAPAPWQRDQHPYHAPGNTIPNFKNVCTVEELERQIRQKQHNNIAPLNHNFYQPRFPPVILQRPPGLQAPVPLPYAPQPQMGPNMGQSLNKIIGNQMGQVGNQMGQAGNQMGQVGNQMGQLPNQMGQVGNQMGQLPNQMGQVGNQMGQMAQHGNQMGQLSNQMGQHGNQMGQVGNQMGPIPNSQLTQNVNQFLQNTGRYQNVNQMNQMVNGNQFGMNQYMMNQPRMMPPPGLSMPRQNFNPNMGQYNPNFRGPSKPMDQPPMNQTNMLNQQLMPNRSSPIMKTTSNQTSQSQTQKLYQQKPREIYNNSIKKTITSENLVQYIQNTHPILQMNSGYHNANHHPMLNNRNGNFNGNQVLNHPMFNNQRNNGSFSNNNRHLMNGDDELNNSKSELDEYAGLMSQREKQWLINIQMLQLNTGTPYIDDFYYTVFLERQSRKEKEGVKEAHKANQQNHPFYSGGVKQETQHRERNNSARLNSQSEEGVQPRIYVPTQFENSLGKLQCGSVTAPRKIIDVEVVQSETGHPTTHNSQRPSRAPSVASTTNPSEVPREVRRTKQLLLDIEALYLILLRLEELNDPLAISNALILKEREEKQKQLEAAQKELESEHDESNLFLKNIESVQRKPKVDSPKADIVDKRQVVNLTIQQNPVPTAKNLLDENKEDLVNKMFAGLLHEDRLQQFLMVRKGKTLISRFLCRVSPVHARLRTLWCRVLRALPQASRRDDGSLAALASHYKQYIQNSNGWSAVLESCGILSEAFDPARTPYALTSSLTISCVCSLLEKATQLTNTPEATSSERQWTKFLKTFARALKNTSLTVAKPLKPIAENKLLTHLRQLESRTTIEILQRGKTITEFADLSKTDLSEQLVRHLC